MLESYTTQGRKGNAGWVGGDPGDRRWIESLDNRTRRQILQTALAPALLAQSRQRNIVFILTGDHRFDFLSCAGHPWVKTPNIDRLAEGGLYFENAFATSSLFSPSRASILTGVYPHTHKVQDNFTPLDSRLPTFPALLQQNECRLALKLLSAPDAMPTLRRQTARKLLRQSPLRSSTPLTRGRRGTYSLRRAGKCRHPALR